MSKNKKILEESFYKMKSIIESRLSEAPEAVVKPTAQSTQAQSQQTVVDSQKRDQQISQNIDATMDAAMKALVDSLPELLSNFAKTSGDKDGVIDAPGVYGNNAQPEGGQTQQAQPIKEGELRSITFDESKFMETMGGDLNEGGLLGIVASAPAILKYGGQASKWIGKKMNSQWLEKWGEKTAKTGEKLHHKYIGLIEKVLKPLMPNATPEQLHKAADGIFMGGVAILFAGGLANPGMLTGIKGAELGQFATNTIKNVLPTLGFA